jgi:superfamily II DNA helicase RecQ
MNYPKWLHPKYYMTLKENFGFEKFRTNQEEIINTYMVMIL